MGRSFSNIMYLIITIIIILGVLKLLGFLLPFILLALAVFWIYRYIKNKTFYKERKTHNMDSNKEQDNDGKAIDVDYEEINKK